MILDKQSWSAAGNPETPQVQWNEVFSIRQLDSDTGFSNRGVYTRN